MSEITPEMPQSNEQALLARLARMESHIDSVESTLQEILTAVAQMKETLITNPQMNGTLIAHAVNLQDLQDAVKAADEVSRTSGSVKAAAKTGQFSRRVENMISAFIGAVGAALLEAFIENEVYPPLKEAWTEFRTGWIARIEANTGAGSSTLGYPGAAAPARRKDFEPEMMRIPAGEFWMGTDRRALERAGIAWESWFEDELPYHRRYLPEYWIAKYPVTRAQFARFEEGGSYWDGSFWTEAGWRWLRDHAPDKRSGTRRTADHPAVDIRWYEALAYCRWLSAETGRAYRLPSEAEWEKAARGTDRWIWPWGNTWDPSCCNNRDTGPRQTTRVGQYSPRGDSPYGVADMAGNVWEWCATKYVDSYRGFEWAEDNDPEGGARRVVRGGSFNNNQRNCRCAYRNRNDPDNFNNNQGFRVVVATLFHMPELPGGPVAFARPSEPRLEKRRGPLLAGDVRTIGGHRANTEWPRTLALAWCGAAPGYVRAPVFLGKPASGLPARQPGQAWASLRRELRISAGG